MECPTCKLGLLTPPPSGQESYLICNECKTIKLKYVPMPQQEVFHKDPHKIKMFAGGMGSGKTITGVYETMDHILKTPSGTTLIGAGSLPQLESTAKYEFLKAFPDILIKDYNKAKNILTTTNGHTVLFRPLDDEEKIRSLNLSFAWIEEASRVKYDIYTQLNFRLRNTATEHQQMILTTNPDMGWIKDKVLLVADKIYNSPVEYLQYEEEINSDISVHIAPSHLNKHLPKNYIESNSKGRPDWYIKRYLMGSFEQTVGLVFPNFMDCIIDPFPIPKNWQRMFGTDFGLANPTVFLGVALDPIRLELHVYAEHYEKQKPVHYHAKRMKEMMAGIPQGLLRFLVADPEGAKRSEKDFMSKFDNYAEYGIYFRKGNNKKMDGILKMFGYFDRGRVKIHKNCQNLIKELMKYKYQEPTLDSKKNESEMPVEKDDHAVDALRYIMMELPDHPDDLVNMVYLPEIVYSHQVDESHLPFELRSNTTQSPYIGKWESAY